MKLKYEQIRDITLGAVRVNQCGNYIQFHRFAEQQEFYYAGTDLHPREYATCGIQLAFITDSKKMVLEICVKEATPIKQFSHDIIVNGVMIDSLKNENEELGEFRKEFWLGEGKKEVRVVFPWSVCSMLKNLMLDGSYIEPVKVDKKLFAFGDSITYGAFAKNPSNRYVAKLAVEMGMEEICKAVGCEIFCPKLIEEKEDIEPDYILVAYGTNDLMTEFQDVESRCNEFFSLLVNHYPNSTIFAVTPLWRKECLDVDLRKRFNRIETLIYETVKDYENIICIRGYDLIPGEEKYFEDSYLHPNDEGFEVLFQTLFAEIIEKTI